MMKAKRELAKRITELDEEVVYALIETAHFIQTNYGVSYNDLITNIVNTSKLREMKLNEYKRLEK